MTTTTIYNVYAQTAKMLQYSSHINSLFHAMKPYQGISDLQSIKLIN